jgi:hypothetical protein
VAVFSNVANISSPIVLDDRAFGTNTAMSAICRERHKPGAGGGSLTEHALFRKE